MSKKKLILLIALAVVVLFVIIGCVFCVLRPDYVREALDILFKNELPY